MAVCGDVGCSEKVIYKQELTEIVADKFSAFLTELRLDTLENRYSTMALDGLTRSVSVQLSDGGELKQIVLHNFYHPTIAMLVLETEGLITDEKFKNLK